MIIHGVRDSLSPPCMRGSNTGHTRLTRLQQACCSRLYSHMLVHHTFAALVMTLNTEVVLQHNKISPMQEFGWMGGAFLRSFRQEL